MERKYKVWLTVSKGAVLKNIRAFRGLLDKKTKLYAVVKSNAYGHGLMQFSTIADNGVDGFCVDSVVEGIKLRTHGIAKPILVLGYSLPALYTTAAKNNIIVTISNMDALAAWRKAKIKPQFHLKIDTGMHRQGFLFSEIPKIISLFENWNLKIENSPLQGIYTHFAMAKNNKDKAFTQKQFVMFQKACGILKEAGFKNLVCHASATGGTLLGKEFHLDLVRVGIGLYGIWPSMELESQLCKKIKLVPVLGLYSVVSEIKTVTKGAGVGYDLTERVTRDTKIAVIPVGYWHGIPRAASAIGWVWIGKSKARIIGRVSMDMIVVDVTHCPCKVGTEVHIVPLEIARSMDASPYEVITRINPLIHKVIRR